MRAKRIGVDLGMRRLWTHSRFLLRDPIFVARMEAAEAELRQFVHARRSRIEELRGLVVAGDTVAAVEIIDRILNPPPVEPPRTRGRKVLARF